MPRATLVVFDENSNVRWKLNINITAVGLWTTLWLVVAAFTIQLAVQNHPSRYPAHAETDSVHSGAERIYAEAGLVENKLDLITAATEELHRATNGIVEQISGLSRILEAQQAESRGSYLLQPQTASLQQELNNIRQATLHAATALNGIQAASRLRKSVLDRIPFGWPVVTRHGTPTGWVSFEFGPRIHPITGDWYIHKGFDIAAQPGTRVVATARGVVRSIEYSDVNYGNNVVIRHGAGFETRFPHLQRIYVEPGQEVEPGMVIGEVGNSGEATGSHLHYEIMIAGQVVDPAPFLQVFTEFAREPAIRRNAIGVP